MFLTLRGPVPVLPGLWSFCSPFPVELTAQSFLLPSTSLLFYHSTDTVFPLDSVSFAFPAQLRPPWVESFYLTTLGLPQPVLWVLQVTPWIRLNGWLPRSLFLHLHFEKDLPVMSAQKSCKESWIPGPSLCPLLLLLQKVGVWSLRLISPICPLRSKTAALTDDRIRIMSEVITGIKTIKMNAWEKSFIDLITRLRR